MMDSLEAIRQKIYEIRGQRVMLDFDLSRCQIGTLNVKRGQNIKLNRAQFDAISEALAELQAGNREQSHSRKPIGFIVEKETAPPTSQRTNNLALTRNNRTQPALLRMVYSHISRVACCLLAVLLFTSCEKEINIVHDQLELYYEESTSLSTLDYKDVRKFDLEVGDFVYQYPDAKKDTLYPKIQANIHAAYTRLNIWPGDWGDQKTIEFEFGEE